MRKYLLVAGLAVATLIPSLAMAQESCQQRSENRTAGTVLGAVGGALLGSAVAGRHDRGEGAVIGGVGGAVVGSNLSKGPRDCAHAYGYYDNDNRWHDNGADRAVAYGYYDRSGAWIDGAPNVAGYSADVAYQAPGRAMDLDTRMSRIEDRIQRGRADGTLSHHETRAAMATLGDIRRDEQNRRRDGRLNDRDEAALQGRLDNLSTQVRMDRAG
ncbi:glycine zipper 2TM domain-containing protein [Phenylobacterium sp.]|uniref:glycine zipper 2TM domain-containing protein n=1 Tax=Phenylobacterium sp. TaxID=1871053 RepID=UPI001201E0AA|nr:glycine zipper 2TM domain-containing protein [Phenylobacterium sp.]THD61476.1 MAG: glycine zipper 2TM domain-containing protein [Phenylobacterium sp.]